MEQLDSLKTQLSFISRIQLTTLSVCSTESTMDKCWCACTRHTHHHPAVTAAPTPVYSHFITIIGNPRQHMIHLVR